MPELSKEVFKRRCYLIIWGIQCTVLGSVYISSKLLSNREIREYLLHNYPACLETYYTLCERWNPTSNLRNQDYEFWINVKRI